MLRRLTLGLAGLSLAVAVSACNSSNTTNLNNGLGVGPDFPTQSLYVADSSQNAVTIYPTPIANNATPANDIGGTTTTINGPQYLTFDNGDSATSLNKSLWITNFNASTQQSSLLAIKSLATGNVFPLQTVTYGNMGQPRGIAINNTTGDLAVAAVFPNAVAPALPSQLQIFTTGDNGASVPFAIISGPTTGLNVPSGMAYDGSGDIFVANRQGGSVGEFVVPTPTPSPSASPSASPSPSPSPSISPSPTPIPTPQVVYDVAPITSISGPATGLVNPTSVALDASGNIYVVDSGNPSIRVFAKGTNGNVAPTKVIQGSLTLLTIPLDVKVDSGGSIYVSDPGAGKVLIFPSTAVGNVAPAITLPAGSGIVGIALSP